MSTTMNTEFNNTGFFDDCGFPPFPTRSPFDTISEDWQQTLDEIVHFPTRENEHPIREEYEYSTDEDDTKPLEQSSIPNIHTRQEKKIPEYIPISDEFARIYTKWYRVQSNTQTISLPKTYNTLSSLGYYWNINPWKFLNESIECIDGWLSDNEDEENWDMVENVIKLYDFYFEIRDNLIYLDE